MAWPSGSFSRIPPIIWQPVLSEPSLNARFAVQQNARNSQPTNGQTSDGKEPKCTAITKSIFKSSKYTFRTFSSSWIHGFLDSRITWSTSQGPVVYHGWFDTLPIFQKQDDRLQDPMQLGTSILAAQLKGRLSMWMLTILGPMWFLSCIAFDLLVYEKSGRGVNGLICGGSFRGWRWRCNGYFGFVLLKMEPAMLRFLQVHAQFRTLHVELNSLKRLRSGPEEGIAQPFTRTSLIFSILNHLGWSCYR